MEGDAEGGGLLNKNSAIFFVVIAAIVLAYFQSVRIDAPNYELKLARHQSVINNTAEYPYKYRVLNPYVTNIYFSVLKSFISEKASFLLSYFIQNVLVYGFLMFMVLGFMRLWFDDTGAVIGLMLFAVLIPLALTGYDTLGDLTTAGLMALGFCCMNKGKFYMLFPVIFIGAFNELQIILLTAFYFTGSDKKDKKVWINSALMAGLFFIAYLIIYALRGGQAGESEFVWYFTKDAAFNIANKDWIILWLIMITPFMYFVLKGLKLKPGFLKRNFLITLPVFYFGAFFFIARLREIDKALTIFLIIIPLALISIIPAHLKKELSS